MSALLPLFLPFDATAQSVDHIISNESHTLPVGSPKLLRPRYAPFYNDGLRITAVDAKGEVVTLNEGSDYVPGDLYERHTQVTGHAVYGCILVLNNTLPKKVEISYRTIGGSQNANTHEVLTKIDEVLNKAEDVPWSEVLDKPRGYTPKQHFQDVRDIYGMEYFSQALRSVRDSLLNLDNSRKNEFRKALVQLTKEWEVIRKQEDAAGLSHFNNTALPHLVTKEQLGLDQLENRDYCTPRTVELQLSSNETLGLNGHASNLYNPHAVTKEQLSLGNVDNLKATELYEPIDWTRADLRVTKDVLNASIPTLLSDMAKNIILGINGGIAKLSNTSKVPVESIPEIMGYEQADLHAYFEGTPAARQTVFNRTVLHQPYCVILLKRAIVICDTPPAKETKLYLKRNATSLGYFLFNPGSKNATYVSVRNLANETIRPGDALKVTAADIADSSIKDITFGFMVAKGV